MNQKYTKRETTAGWRRCAGDYPSNTSVINNIKDSKGQRLRNLLSGPGTVLRPCAYDALSAVLIDRAGFDVIGTTGYGISASLAGQPDMGFVDSSAMLDRARSIIHATDKPVDVDIDTGQGNALNVNWVVKNFIRAGAASLRLEDQEWPKRCGHMEGKSIIPTEDMVRKIESAVMARDDEDETVLVGARTDARSVEGTEAVIDRGRAYAAAGADYVYVEAPQSLEEVSRLTEEIPAYLAFNIIPGGRTPPFDIEDVESIGVDFLSVPMVALYPAVKAMQESLRILKEERDIERIGEMGVSWSEFNDIVGFDEWRRLELELCSDEDLRRRYGTTDIGAILEGEAEQTERQWANAD
ncbi:MAG: oxaloacetate decarboxylase [Halodesulfurarchaeum sp.]